MSIIVSLLFNVRQTDNWSKFRFDYANIFSFILAYPELLFHYPTYLIARWFWKHTIYIQTLEICLILMLQIATDTIVLRAYTDTY